MEEGYRLAGERVRGGQAGRRVGQRLAGRRGRGWQKRGQRLDEKWRGRGWSEGGAEAGAGRGEIRRQVRKKTEPGRKDGQRLAWTKAVRKAEWRRAGKRVEADLKI